MVRYELKEFNNFCSETNIPSSFRLLNSIGIACSKNSENKDIDISAAVGFDF